MAGVSLLDLVTAEQNLLAAWRRVQENIGAPPRPVRPPDAPLAPPAEEDAAIVPERGVAVDAAAPPLLRTLYLTEHGVYLSRAGERVEVRKGDESLASIPIEKIDQILAVGEGAVSFGALRHFMRRGIGVVVLDEAGEPLGALTDLSATRTELHRAQFERAADAAFCADAARAIVSAKIANSRLLLRRYFRFRTDRAAAGAAADAELQRIRQALVHAVAVEAIRGYEGLAARHYYAALDTLLAPRWRMTGRNRQPPRDPVNALLSYGYAILYHTLHTLVARRGLHPGVGSLHAQRDGHAALVSDLMEEFRALVVDAVVVKLLLHGQAEAADFDDGGPAAPCRIGATLRKEFARLIEARLSSPLKHPDSGKTLDYRRAMLWQVARWADCVAGRAPAYRPLVLR